MLIFALLVALVAAENAIPGVIKGTATITYDFTKLGPDVSVSTCDQKTYMNQGRGVRTYVINTTNFHTPCPISIVEGGNASLAQTYTLWNEQHINAWNYLANLTIHLERYNPASCTTPNTFCVRLRSSGQIFRDYCDLPHGNNTRVPLSDLYTQNGNVDIGANQSVIATVLATTQPVTVFVGENTASTESAVWVLGHTGNGLAVDSNCAAPQYKCDSGRLVAVLDVPLLCKDGVGGWPETDILLSWDPVPSVYVSARNFCTYPNRAGNRHHFFNLLAVDTIKVNVSYDPSRHNFGGNAISKELASACADGTCEALPVTSNLKIDSPGLIGTAQVYLNGLLQWGPVTVTDETTICVFNLRTVAVTVSYGSIEVSHTGIDCQVNSQMCNAGIFTSRLYPDWGCLSDSPMGPASVQLYVYDTYTATAFLNETIAAGSFPQYITVPAINTFRVEVIEGGAQCSSTVACTSCAALQGSTICAGQTFACAQDARCAACLASLANTIPSELPYCHDPADPVQELLNPVLSCISPLCQAQCQDLLAPYEKGCARWNLPTTTCAYTWSGEQTSCGTTGGTFGRILSIFELAFLPLETSVSLTGIDGIPFRAPYLDQGELPQCYCVLPTVLRGMIAEGSSMWASHDTSCVEAIATVHSPFDCSICDFLSILKFDLIGLPSSASGEISAGPNGSAPTPFRLLYYIGDSLQEVTVLRAGAGTLPPKRYCVEVNDNGATLSLCTVCDNKVCHIEGYTVDMCADLANPAGTSPGAFKGVNGLLIVRLHLLDGRAFRTIFNQGGVNGCAIRGPIDYLKKRKDIVAKNSLKREEAGHFESSDSIYTVLRGNYQFSVSEASVSLPRKDVFCAASPDQCEALRLISLFTVSTACGNGAPGSPSFPTANVDATLLDQSGIQFRGPRSFLTKDCLASPPFWSGPTMSNAGNMLIRFAVLAAPVHIRLDENVIGYNPAIYPNPFQHPIVVIPVNCATTNLTCSMPFGRAFSTLAIVSERGLPVPLAGDSSPAHADLKFGVEQNVLRIYSPSQLLGGSTERNLWCVLADPRPLYAINWQNYASDGPGRPFANCASRSATSASLCIVNPPANLTLVVPSLPEGK